MDLIFFGGQSNMEGQTEGVPLDTAPVGGALEYRYKTREYVPLAHPVGEDIPPLCPANYGFARCCPTFAAHMCATAATRSRRYTRRAELQT